MRSKPQAVASVQNGDEAVALWGCSVISGPGVLKKVNRMGRKEVYFQILEENPKGSERLLGWCFNRMSDEGTAESGGSAAPLLIRWGLLIVDQQIAVFRSAFRIGQHRKLKVSASASSLKKSDWRIDVEQPIWHSRYSAYGQKPLFYCLSAPRSCARFPQEHPRPLY